MELLNNDVGLTDINIEPIERASYRLKADRAKKLRDKTLICVLENPNDIINIASVMRNIDSLGVSKLYVISNKPNIINPSKKVIKNMVRPISASAYKWVYTKYFSTTQECLQHLEKNNFVSLVTSPHIKGKENMSLLKSDFTKYKKLAVWFGNESHGISPEAIEGSRGCIQIEMGGIIESLNLSVSTGIVLNFIVNQRREFTQKLLERRTKNKIKKKTLKIV